MKNYFWIYLLAAIFIVSNSAENANNSRAKRNEPMPNSRILGGRDASVGQFPYQVLLRLRGWPFCGAAIISRRYVITAAHCVIKNNKIFPAAYLTIRAGSIFLKTGGIIIQVAAIKPHPNYRSGFIENDIAILKLATLLNFSDRIKSISLANTTTALPTGSIVMISGWGRTQTNGSMSNTLQYTVMHSITNSECRNYLVNLSNSILCLTPPQNGIGACHGDSGGPAVYSNRIVGVANFAIGRCGSTAPDGYARIAAFNDWIRQNSDV